MREYKFKVGDPVRFTVLWPGTPTGIFVVLSRHGLDLPDPTYRVRSVDDGSLRLGIQSEMARVERDS